jgi:hypothetical protein
MATFSITHQQRVDNVAVIQTLTGTDIGVGQAITVAGCGTGFNGSQTVISTEPFLFSHVDDEGDLIFDYDVIVENQILFQNVGDDVSREGLTTFGTLTWTETCSWVNVADVQQWLGIDSATANDTAFLTTCVNASNSWCFTRRKASGYTDSLSTVPNASVKLGAIMFAAVQYRERGSVDSYASFSSMGAPTPILSLGQIHRLLGVNRSQVG